MWRQGPVEVRCRAGSRQRPRPLRGITEHADRGGAVVADQPQLVGRGSPSTGTSAPSTTSARSVAEYTTMRPSISPSSCRLVASGASTTAAIGSDASSFVATRATPPAVVGHLDLQPGLEHLTHQRRQQAVIAGQLDAVLAGSVDELGCPLAHCRLVTHQRDTTRRPRSVAQRRAVRSLDSCVRSHRSNPLQPITPRWWTLRSLRLHTKSECPYRAALRGNC